MTNLELARRRKRMTLRQVASEAGCSHAMVSLVERGQRVPSETVARCLTRAVGLPAPQWKTLQKPC